MQKSYKMKQYATEVDWTKYIPQSDIKSSSKFAPVQTPMIESYVQIEKKMLK